MMTHTPGPWITGKQNIAVLDGCRVNRVPISGSGQAIAGVWNGSVGKGDVSNGDANARLIAAAPELLEALQAVIRSRHWSIDFERNRTHESLDLRRKVIAAIDKAT